MDKYTIGLRNINAETLRSLEGIFIIADAEVAKSIAKYRLRYPNTYAEGLFYERNQALAEEISSIMQQLRFELDRTISSSVEKSWALANTKNDTMINSYLSGTNIPASIQASFMKVNMSALQAFIERTEKGITLSSRIWNLVDQKQKSLERLLASGITIGRSASQISRDIRAFENNPNMLFRRIRDQKGKLKLSKPAMNYHPGKGVYRSSYKNAMRVSRTENMIAYHTADYTRTKDLPFVLGIEVHLSDSHPRLDICDSMIGEYPKEFMFTGWHPQCLCYTTTKLASKKDFMEFIETGEMNKYKDVVQIPHKAETYLRKNIKAIRDMSSKPYFVLNNDKIFKALNL
jgi:hypothetical protein